MWSVTARGKKREDIASTMEGLKEVDENENTDNFDGPETEAVAAKDEGGVGGEAYKNIEPTKVY